MILVVIYIMCMVLANYLIFLFGPWFSPINAFLLIGLDMVIRDRLHDRWLGKNLVGRMGALIVVSSLITYLLNPTMMMIAVASSLAFASAMIVNGVIYHFVHKRQWMVRSNVSNIGGSATDSVVFPTVAFGAMMPEIILLQFAAKMLGGLLWSYVFKKVMGIK